MRYALISDIHANLPALEAVLNSIALHPEIDATYHLGDLVGYGPWPDETIALLKAFRVAGIQGNHDAKIGTSGAPSPRGPDQPLSHVEWTARETSEESKALLARLPFRMDLRPAGGHAAGPRVILAHGTPLRIDQYWFEGQPESFFLEMAASAGARAGDVVCCGHTHLPWHRVVGGIHFVNTGSVGRPKDGDWRAGYIVLDMNGEQPIVEFARVEYDLELVAGAIQRSDLPDEFVEYLRMGGEPDAASTQPAAG